MDALSNPDASSGPCGGVAPQAFKPREQEVTMRVLSRVAAVSASRPDRRFGWDKLPLPLGLLTIAGLRATMRKPSLVLMAARRLKSDRFFTRDYTCDFYTGAGMDWINETTMTDVLLRHCPELGPALHGVGNAFKPWKRVTT